MFGERDTFLGWSLSPVILLLCLSTNAYCSFVINQILCRHCWGFVWVQSTQPNSSLPIASHPIPSIPFHLNEEWHYWGLPSWWIVLQLDLQDQKMVAELGLGLLMMESHGDYSYSLLSLCTSALSSLLLVGHESGVAFGLWEVMLVTLGLHDKYLICLSIFSLPPSNHWTMPEPSDLHWIVT